MDFTLRIGLPQLEQGALATSVIPTTTTALTRAADAASVDTVNPWYNSAEGALYAEFSVNGYSSTAFPFIAQLGVAGVGNRGQIIVLNGPSNNTAFNIFDDTTTYQGVAGTGPATLNTTIRIAGAYKANDSAASFNGSSPTTDTSVTLATGINRLSLGQSALLGGHLNGHLRRIIYYRRRLTNAEQQALTAGVAVPADASLDLNFVGNANGYYEGRIQQPANVQRTAFSSYATTGRSQIGFGNLVLTNMDGGLDALLDYSFAGRAITIRLGEVLPNSGGVPTWVTVIKGTMEQAEFSWQKVTVRVRDRQQDLAKPLQQVRYAGNNSLPAGLEGVEGDIKGRPKPLVFGQVFNAPITLVNTSRLIYQAHDGSALQSVDAVYDRGAVLTAGAAYSSQADMETNAPSAGQYRVWNSVAGTYIRLGSTPAGTVTADLTQGAAASNRTAGQLWNAILTKAGVAAGDISSADVTALDAAVAYPCGVFCATDYDMTALEAADIVCGSVGAWFGSDALGVFRLGRLVLPTGTSVGTINATDIISIERVASRDPGVGIPAWKVKLGYQRIWEVQPDTTANVTAVRKGYLAQEYRRIEASDSAVLSANLTSPEIELLTTLVSATDASAEASRRLTIYKTRRDMIDVRVRVDAALASVLDIGKIVTLQVNRYGLSAGKQFLIIGLRTDMRGRLFDLTLWG